MHKVKTKLGGSKAAKFTSHGKSTHMPLGAKTVREKFTGTMKSAHGSKLIKVSLIRSRLGISQVEMSRFTGYSVRAIADWETGQKTVSQPARQKLAETERLSTALERLIPRGEVAGWLHSPNEAFEGQTPLQIIERGESDRIWRMIFQIEAGVAN